MKLVVDLLGRTFPLELQVEGNTARFRLGEDAERVASVVEVEPGVYSVLANGRSYDVRVAGRPGTQLGQTTVLLRGHAINVDVRDPRELSASKSAAAGHGRQQLASPMPGKVVRILVAVGDSVDAGQGLIVVEAMKMQNEMKSPKAGVVVELKAREGATVAAGDVLAVIE